MCRGNGHDLGESPRVKIKVGPVYQSPQGFMRHPLLQYPIRPHPVTPPVWRPARVENCWKMEREALEWIVPCDWVTP